MNNWGSTSLLNACGLQEPGIVRLLLDWGADPNVKNRDGDCALSYALKRRNAEVVGILLERIGRFEPRSLEALAALLYAIHVGSLETVDRLLRMGVDVNGREPGGLTPLRVAVGCGRTDIVDILIEAGAVRSQK
jgi:ankyrin repeat protein